MSSHRPTNDAEGGTICSWGWCMFLRNVYFYETHWRLHLSCHVTTDLRLLPIGASRWPWCPNGILLGSPIWIPLHSPSCIICTCDVLYFKSCLYISLSCILSILFLFTLRYFLIWVLDAKRGQKVYFFNWSTWSSVFVCLPVSLSPNCSRWYVQPEQWSEIRGTNPKKEIHQMEDFPVIWMWIQHWQLMQIFLNWVETTTEKINWSI